MDNLLASNPAGQQARQRLASSNAYALVQTAAPEEEVRRALLPDDRKVIAIARHTVEQELRAPDDDLREAIAVCLGRQIGLLKMGAPVEAKEEWIGLALDDLSHLPAGLVLDALPQVRRIARFEGDVVPGVLDIVTPKVERLEAERRTLERLAAIAG